MKDSSMPQAYNKLCDTFKRIHRLEHLMAIGSWDMYVLISNKGSQARSEALSELGVEIQRRLTDSRMGEWFAAAEEESLNEVEHVNLREMRRVYQQAVAVPAELNEALVLAGNQCEFEWRSQRPANDWVGFSKNLREVVRLSREKADILAHLKGMSRYDALLDEYEPGMTSARIDEIFSDLAKWLPDLIKQAQARQASEPTIALSAHYPEADQHALALDIMKRLQFDFDAGRLDSSAHPFSGGVPTDSRITTRYDESDFLPSLMSVIHETGHSRYEQNLPAQYAGLPLGQARSMGIHESQSLSFEMQLARTDEFISLITPSLNKHLKLDPPLTPQQLGQLARKVVPGKIRVDADELTYPAHIMLRYEIERALIEGDMEVDDIPEAWDARMNQYLGIDTRGDYRNGCMQDIHWTDGSFGYFPTYSLGAIYAAQLFQAANRDIANLHENIQRGELTPLFDWYREAIWQHGRRYSSEELIQRATGSPVSTHAYHQHLESRYGDQ